MSYQTFPGSKGDSSSLDKLIALRLPSLRGKSFLDIGCNEGFFCGYALFDGATHVVGIDRSIAAIDKARQKFPQCEFYDQPWDSLPEGSFDVILLASALHYADDQEALIHSLMGKLTANGTLVIELGMINSPKDEWVKVSRSIDERIFPTRKKMSSVLEKYAWKTIGYSVTQAGDPVQRYVLHVSHLKPYALMMLEPPASGKTTLSRLVFDKSSICTLSGDAILMQISNKSIEGSSALNDLVRANFTTTDIAEVTLNIFNNDLGKDLIDVWCSKSGGKTFAIDSYVPEKNHDLVKSYLEEKGYIPVSINLSTDISLPSHLSAKKTANNYFDYLTKRADQENIEYVIVKKVKNDSPLESLLHKWHLDHPYGGQPFPSDQSLRFAGWVLSKKGQPPCSKCYIEWNGQKKYIEVNQTRTDVINSIKLQDEMTAGQTAQCGFNFALEKVTSASWINLGFVIGDQEICTAKIRRAPQRKAPLKFSEKSLSAIRDIIKTKLLSR